MESDIMTYALLSVATRIGILAAGGYIIYRILRGPGRQRTITLPRYAAPTDTVLPAMAPVRINK